MNKPTFWNYCDYSNSNYGTHSLAFEDAKGNIYYYSYNTLIAFNINGEFHIMKNYWSNTTGRHLNSIDPDKTIREDRDTFERNLERLTRDPLNMTA